MGTQVYTTAPFVRLRLLNGGSMIASTKGIHQGVEADDFFRLYDWAFYIHEPHSGRHVLWDVGLSQVRPVRFLLPLRLGMYGAYRGLHIGLESRRLHPFDQAVHGCHVLCGPGKKPRGAAAFHGRERGGCGYRFLQVGSLGHHRFRR